MNTTTQTTPASQRPLDVHRIIACLWANAQNSLDRDELEYLGKADELATTMHIQMCQRTDALATLWSEVHSQFGKTGLEDVTHSILWELVNSMWLVHALHEVGQGAQDRLKMRTA